VSNPHLQSGAIAIVTGAASGLGKGLADALVARGLIVIYTDIQTEAVNAAAAAANQLHGGQRASALTLDVSDSEAFEALIAHTIAQHGKLDLLINNAGFAVMGEALHTRPQDYRRIVDVNFMGVVNGTLPAFQRMAQQRGGGHIVNIASLAGLTPFPFAASYAATKAAVVNFSNTLRCEGASLGVKITSICPGFIDTRIFENATYLQLDATSVKQGNPLPTISLFKAVQHTLQGIERNVDTHVFPFHARVLWWLMRLHHRLPNPLTNMLLSKARALGS
jgi:NAD(P)-dependent dehydrogenase (short-subunit alcohol dehydrogenase family)